VTLIVFAVNPRDAGRRDEAVDPPLRVREAHLRG
jgi:hypothetical protein